MNGHFDALLQDRHMLKYALYELFKYYLISRKKGGG